MFSFFLRSSDLLGLGRLGTPLGALTCLSLLAVAWGGQMAAHGNSGYRTPPDSQSFQNSLVKEYVRNHIGILNVIEGTLLN